MKRAPKGEILEMFALASPLANEGNLDVRRWIRQFLLVGAVLLAIAGVAWTIHSTRLPKADFTFVNGTEIKSVDPQVVTGQPEGRIIHALYEGLVNWDPQTLAPIQGVAERWETSTDGRVITFHLREAARWSDDSPLTAEDFVYSFRRLLDPEMAAEYANQLWYLKNGRRYTAGETGLAVGDPVEIELHERPAGSLPFARNQVERGTLKLIIPEVKPTPTVTAEQVVKEKAAAEAATKTPPAAPPASAAAATQDATALAAVHLAGRVFVLDIAGVERRFRETKSLAQPVALDEVPCKRMLFDFNHVGVKAINPHVLQVTLENPTPYFISLTGFYPLFPVQQKCLETYGDPNWTRPKNLVTNGPYKLTFRRVRDVIRLTKSTTYWNRQHVQLETIDALAIESQTTALSLYLTGEVDWLPGVPHTVVKTLLQEKPEELPIGELYAINFLRCNTARPPLNDLRVRRALAMSIDREEIIRTVLQAGEDPAFSLVPSGVEGYPAKATFTFDLPAAQKLLAEAGYPGGEGFPRVSFLYNESEGNAAIGQLLQSQWRKNLGIDVSLAQEEWSSYLARARRGDYSLVRGGWIGDYRDPNTFLELFITGVPNNQTGWGNKRYDELLAAGEKEADPAKRWALFREAEQILGDEMPIIPVSFYVSKNLVKPYVRGFYPNAMDMHPLDALSIDRQRKQAFIAQERP